MHILVPGSSFVTFRLLMNYVVLSLLFVGLTLLMILFSQLLIYMQLVWLIFSLRLEVAPISFSIN